MSSASDTLFSSLEIDTIGEIMNISMGSAATAASTLLDSKVNITTPIVKVLSVDDLEIGSFQPAIAVDIKYVEGITGSNMLILREEDIKKILSRMMQMDIPDDFEMDEMSQSAVCELMNQMMGSSATVLSCFLGRDINISTPTVVAINEFSDLKDAYFQGDNTVITVSFTLSVEDLVDSEFMCAMQVDLAKEIIDVSLNFDTGESTVESAPAPAPPPPMPTPAPAPPPMPTAVQSPPMALPMQQDPMNMPMAPQQPGYAPGPY